MLSVAPPRSREQRDLFPVDTMATNIPDLRFPANLAVIQVKVQSQLILLLSSERFQIYRKATVLLNLNWSFFFLMKNLLIGCLIRFPRNALQLILDDLPPTCGRPTPACVTSLLSAVLRNAVTPLNSSTHAVIGNSLNALP